MANGCPTFELILNSLKINYPKYNSLLNESPDLMHYSPGVKLIAWGRINYCKDTYQKKWSIQNK